MITQLCTHSQTLLCKWTRTTLQNATHSITDTHRIAFTGRGTFPPTLTVCYYSDSNYHKTVTLSLSWRSGRTLRLALLFGEGPHTSESFSPKKSSRINRCRCLLLSLLNYKYFHPAYPNPVPPLIIWRLVWHVASPWSAQRPFFKNSTYWFRTKSPFFPG